MKTFSLSFSYDGVVYQTVNGENGSKKVSKSFTALTGEPLAR